MALLRRTQEVKAAATNQVENQNCLATVIRIAKVLYSGYSFHHVHPTLPSPLTRGVSRVGEGVKRDQRVSIFREER